MKKAVLLIFFFVSVNWLFGQNTVSNSQLANEYYQSKEYEKAAVLYEELFNTTKSRVYFNYYLRCLLELEEYDVAERRIKRQIRQQPHDLGYVVDMGTLYEAQGKTEEATAQYEQAIDEVTANKNQVVQLANTFLMKSEYEYAERTYTKGRQLISSYGFYLEMASVYTMQRDYEKMFDEYLDYLNIHPGQQNMVQDRLQYIIINDGSDDLNGMLKEKLLHRIQQRNAPDVYNEMLVWLYIQDKEFSRALFQAKALDRRNQEDGRRIIDLARLAASNAYFDVAYDAYKYVADKGQNTRYYYAARYGALKTLYDQTVNTAHVATEAEIHELEQKYVATLNELQPNDKTVLLKRDLAHLKAFYLGEHEAAIQLLQEAINAPLTTPETYAECQIEMADIMLFTGDVWGATMLYYQVEKNNEQNPRGHEAKFKNARLAYFNGDFKLAQAQLDVLKASTSKLIANDAFELSILISDNTIMDTVETAMQIFARADLLLMQNRLDDAMISLDSIVNQFPTHSLIDEVYYKKAQIYKNQRNFEKTAEYLEKVVSGFSYDIYADDAIFELAVLKEEEFGEKETAMELYKQIITEHSGSIYVAEARKRYRALRGDNI